MPLENDLRVRVDAPKHVGPGAALAAIVAPLPLAEAPLLTKFRPGMKTAGQASGSGVSGQLHQLELMNSAPDVSRPMRAIEKMLRTRRVRLPSRAQIQARLYAMVSDHDVRHRHIDAHLLPQLSKLAGKSCTLGELLVACSKAKTTVAQAIEEMGVDRRGSALRLAAKIVDDRSSLFELSRLALIAYGSSKPQMTLEEARASLKSEGDGGVEKIWADRPNNPEIMIDLLKGLMEGALDQDKTGRLIEAFGVAGVKPLMAALETDDLKQLGLVAHLLGCLGPLASAAAGPLVEAFARVERATVTKDSRDWIEWARGHVLDALASIDGAAFMARPEAMTAIEAELKSHDRERVDTAVRLISSGGPAGAAAIRLLVDVPVHIEHLVQVLAGIGPEAWPALVELLKSCNTSQVWRDSAPSLGPIPEACARALFEVIKEQGVRRALLDPLSDASPRLKADVARHILDKASGDKKVEGLVAAVDFLVKVAAAEKPQSSLRLGVVDLLRRKLEDKYFDRELGAQAYRGLMKLLPQVEADALTKHVLYGDSSEWAVHTILHGERTQAPKGEGFKAELEWIASSVNHPLETRDLARERLGLPIERRAELMIDDMMVTRDLGYSAFPRLRAMVEPSRWPLTVVQIVEEGTPYARENAVHALVQLVRDENLHAPDVAQRFLASVQNDAALLGRLGEGILGTLREWLARELPRN